MIVTPRHASHNQKAHGRKSAGELASSLEEKYGIELLMSDRRAGHVVIDKIVVPKDKRGSGVGSKAMDEITSWADEGDITLALTPSSDFGGTKSRLVTFYKRFGFVENKGRNKDYEISESMYRPRKSERALRVATSLREVLGYSSDLAKFFRHLSGQHDQKTHGRKSAGEILADKAVMQSADLAALSGLSSDEQFALVIGSRSVISEGQSKVTEAFDELPDDVREVALGRLDEVSEVRHRFGQIEGSDRVVGAYDPADKSMDVSLVRPADGGGVRLVTADEYADNFMHELGHAVDFRGGANSAAENGMAGQFMTRQARREYQAGDENLWYAASHPREMAAEAFKGYTRGSGGLSPSEWREKYPDLTIYVESGMNK